MKNTWKEVEQELNRIVEVPLKDLADEIVSYDKTFDEYRAALAGKALKDMNGELITISRRKLWEFLQGITDCRVCPINTFCEARRRNYECDKRLVRWLADEWDEGIYPEEDEDA